MSLIAPEILQWIASRKHQPLEFQQRTWEAIAAGKSGLVHAPTGMGKTFAVWLGILSRWFADGARRPALEGRKLDRGMPLEVLWITPMRALAADTAVSLLGPVQALDIPWSVETRTGDTSASDRKRQKLRLPTTLITTPESVSVLLSQVDARELFDSLRYIVVDEWHELLGTKRGVQTELALARLRRWRPSLQTWGLSATLGNLTEAREVLLGGADGEQIASDARRSIVVDTILPQEMQRFPWSGHLGLHLVPQVIERIEQARTSLLFTNTRSQAERWYQSMLAVRPDLEASIALHHGSVDSAIRGDVEDRLRRGELRCAVCTSSLDLGVDFAPVEQVIQVGSPKGIARLIQRAGRSGHQPDGTSRIVCVPTHAIELVEYSAAREAAASSQLESRRALECPLDLLAQHLVTIACSEPFAPEELLAEVRTTYAYRNITDDDFQWVLDFVEHGGKTLRAYPQYSKLREAYGRYSVASKQIERWHRMSIGTITSDAGVSVRYLRGGNLGTIEESFIARLKKGDVFLFAGKSVELVMIRDMVAYVRKSRRAPTQVPRWMGGKLPLSVELGNQVRKRMAEARQGIFSDREMQCVEPVLRLQQQLSDLPHPDELLVEHVSSREGDSLFIYPFEGRLVHEGLAALLAYRMSQLAPASIAAMVNDYGLQLSSATPLELDDAQWRQVLSPANLLEDLESCLNAAELARRQFRDIARVSGLIVPGFPGGGGRSMKQLQASSTLLFDVFQEYDAENRLLAQARREVLTQQLEYVRLEAALERISKMRLNLMHPIQLTPLAFPLWAARVQATHVSSEAWTTRVERMAEQLEQRFDRWEAESCRGE